MGIVGPLRNWKLVGTLRRRTTAKRIWIARLRSMSCRRGRRHSLVCMLLEDTERRHWTRMGLKIPGWRNCQTPSVGCAKSSCFGQNHLRLCRSCTSRELNASITCRIAGLQGRSSIAGSGFRTGDLLPVRCPYTAYVIMCPVQPGLA